jgi:hypothetical protein
MAQLRELQRQDTTHTVTLRGHASGDPTHTRKGVVHINCAQSDLIQHTLQALEVQESEVPTSKGLAGCALLECVHHAVVCCVATFAWGGGGGERSGGGGRNDRRPCQGERTFSQQTQLRQSQELEKCIAIARHPMNSAWRCFFTHHVAVFSGPCPFSRFHSIQSTGSNRFYPANRCSIPFPNLYSCMNSGGGGG